MRRRWWSLVGLSVITSAALPACTGDDDSRAEPKMGKQVVLAEYIRDDMAGGVALDAKGTVYTSQWDDRGDRFVITAFPEQGKPTMTPIPCASQEGAHARISTGRLAAAPDGTLYWSLDIQSRIVRLGPDGRGGCIVGGDPGPSADGSPEKVKVGYVDELTYDPEGAVLYFSESAAEIGKHEKSVRKIDPAGAITTVVGPEGFSGTGYDHEVLFDARTGRLYTIERGGIAYLGRDGARTVITGTESISSQLNALAADPTGGDLVAARARNVPERDYCDLVRVSEQGEVRPVPGGNLGDDCAQQILVDGRGDIWVSTRSRLMVVRPSR